MKPVGTSTIVFVSLSGLFWGGWLVGSQTPQGQEALAKAYAHYTAEQAVSEADLFETTALRALVCGQGAGPLDSNAKPCLAVAAAGRLFVIDAGSGAAMALENKRVPLGKLEAVLLTGADPVRSADLDELWVAAQGVRDGKPLPVYGPAGSYPMIEGLNMALSAQGATGGLQSWAPAPEPDQPVIVFEDKAAGLVVSAFTTKRDAMTGKVGYRFDYRGRSLVIAGDGRAEWAEAAADADVVMQGAENQMLAQLHHDGLRGSSPFEVASAAKDAGAGMLVLTGVDPNPMMADIQVRQAREAGLRDVVAGRIGLLLELPLANREVNVRPL
jgi:ribonuclease Z